MPPTAADVRQWKKLLGVRSPTPELKKLTSIPMATATWADLPAEGYLEPVPTFADQKSAGSCTAHGGSAPVEQLTARALAGVGGGGMRPQLSRMWLYYMARALRGWEREDSGALIGDIVRVFSEYGCPSEHLWPYDASKVTTQKPPAAAKDEAVLHRVTHRRLVGALQVAAALAGFDRAPARGAMFGMPCYESFFSKTSQDGVVRGKSGSIYGYHCIWFCGFKKDMFGSGKHAVLAMNSWGGWGIPHPTGLSPQPYGFCWFPVHLVDDQAFTFDVFAPNEPLPVSE